MTFLRILGSAYRMRNEIDTRRKWLQTIFSAVVLSVRVWHFHPVESRASVVTRMASQAILHDTAFTLSLWEGSPFHTTRDGVRQSR
jgi:hypothetical protein